MCRMFGEMGASGGEFSGISSIQRLLCGGPDEQTLRWGQDWVFGHTRLAINGLTHGSQPYTAPGLNCLFVGEIYNYQDLARQYGLKTTRQGSDGEVILPLFEKFGPAFVEKLEGMFSIAIVDTRQSKTLYLFTDSCAIKPVYYIKKSGVITFASEIEGLPNLDGEDRSVPAVSFDRYGAYRAMLGRQTIFPKVKVLEPKTYLVFQNDQTEIHHYQPDLEKPSSLTNQRDDFTRAIESGVRQTLITDVPVCATLSGGLDSSLVASLASRDPRMKDAFNVWYEGRWTEDETGFARDVARNAGLRYHQVVVKDKEFPDKILKMCQALSQPNAAAHCLSTFVLYEHIGKAGFKVALVGEGADDFFGGYDRIASVATKTCKSTLNDYIADLSAIDPSIRKDLVHPDGMNKSHNAALTDFLMSLPGDTLLRKILTFESRHRLPYYILHRVDALSMAHSVEARVPFCLPSVYRYALHARACDLVADTFRKKPVYDASAGNVPESVVNRPKQPFLLPIAGMLQPGYPVYELLMDTLSSPKVTGTLVDLKFLKALIARNVEKPANITGNAIWAWLIYELWAQEHNVSIQ